MKVSCVIIQLRFEIKILRPVKRVSVFLPLIQLIKNNIRRIRFIIDVSRSLFAKINFHFISVNIYFLRNFIRRRNKITLPSLPTLLLQQAKQPDDNSKNLQTILRQRTEKNNNRREKFHTSSPPLCNLIRDKKNISEKYCGLPARDKNQEWNKNN